MVFGASGMAGAAFFSAAVRRGFETKAFSHRNPVKVDGIAGHTRLDLNDLNGLERPLLDMWPDVIVNAAAVSEPDKVDQDPEAATRINVDFPSRLAEIANHLGARLIHLSSDLVFDGSQSPYRSTDLPNPLSSYGKQKLDAEKKVLKRCPENLVVLRVTILTGNSPSGRRSVHEKMLRSISKGKRLTLFADEYRQPCSCDSLAAALVELCQKPKLNGLFHWAGADRLSRYEMGQLILDRFALPQEVLKTGERKDFAGEDKRPADLAFNLQPLQGKLSTSPATFSEQLEAMDVPDDLFPWFQENSQNPSCYVRRLVVD